MLNLINVQISKSRIDRILQKEKNNDSVIELR